MRRPLEAVFEDATALFAEAAALMRRAHGIRQELEAATATGVEETERLVHGATVAGIEAGLVQGLEVAQRSLKDALEATTGLEPAAPEAAGGSQSRAAPRERRGQLTWPASFGTSQGFAASRCGRSGKCRPPRASAAHVAADAAGRARVSRTAASGDRS